MPLEKLYPLKFDPILKERPWGGIALPRLKGIPAIGLPPVGESWEISGMPGAVSVVRNGNLRGKSLSELSGLYGSSLLGKRVYKQYSGHFPLLVKLIDARENLSIQVHPDDSLARKRHGCSGKTEAWVVLDAEPDACLYAGFNRPVTREDFTEAVEHRTVPGLLRKEPVKPGDVFFVPAGTVHAIGKGVLILEIQQASDITYRIDDWGRTDPSGHSRELHTDLALDAIDFSACKTGRAERRIEPEMAYPILSGDQFQLHLRNTNIGSYYTPPDSLAVLFGIDGPIKLSNGTESGETLNKNECVLVPAHTGELPLDGSGSFLEIHV